MEQLAERGVKLKVLDIGADNILKTNPVVDMFFKLDEYQRKMRVERILEGKQIKMQTDADATLGRPKKFKKDQRDMAIKLLKKHSYNEVADMTGISRRTLIRYKKEYEMIK